MPADDVAWDRGIKSRVRSDQANLIEALNNAINALIRCKGIDTENEARRCFAIKSAREAIAKAEGRE